MTSSTGARVPWADAGLAAGPALARPDRAESLAGVVRRLGAVLSMDEAHDVAAGRAGGGALVEGEVIRATAFRGAVVRACLAMV